MDLESIASSLVGQFRGHRETFDPDAARAYVDSALQTCRQAGHAREVVHLAFCVLALAREKSSLVGLLNRYIQTGLGTDEEAWARWNISDNLAMMRDAKGLAGAHRQFYAMVKECLPPEKWHWVASDATQALTLFRGNESSLWCEIHQWANHSAPKTSENRGARFESHRATAIALAKNDRGVDALNACGEISLLLDEDPEWANRHFVTTTYFTLAIDAHRAAQQADEVAKIVARVVEYQGAYQSEVLSRVSEEEPVVTPYDRIGSWEYLNETKAPYGWLRTATTNLAASLYRAREYRLTVELMGKAVTMGQQFNAYLSKLYAAALWKTGGERIQVAEVLLRPRLVWRGDPVYWRDTPELQDLVDDEEFKILLRKRGRPTSGAPPSIE